MKSSGRTVPQQRHRRRATPSLGFAPELGQQTMTEELLALLHEIFRQWTGALPRLAYPGAPGPAAKRKRSTPNV